MESEGDNGAGNSRYGASIRGVSLYIVKHIKHPCLQSSYGTSLTCTRNFSVSGLPGSRVYPTIAAVRPGNETPTKPYARRHHWYGSPGSFGSGVMRSEEHTSELQSLRH